MRSETSIPNKSFDVDTVCFPGAEAFSLAAFLRRRAEHRDWCQSGCVRLSANGDMRRESWQLTKWTTARRNKWASVVELVSRSASALRRPLASCVASQAGSKLAQRVASRSESRLRQPSASQQQHDAGCGLCRIEAGVRAHNDVRNFKM